MATRWVREPVMEECVRCHRAQKAPVSCDSCHAGRGQKERLSVGPWQVTHGKEWRSAHGMGDIRYCRTCHPVNYCVRCHNTVLPHPTDFGRTHGSQAKRDIKSCLACHDRAGCDSCHGLTIPHPAGFLKRHSSQARSYEDPTCAKCHRETDCQRCHVLHIHPGRTDGTLGSGPGGAIKLPKDVTR